MDDSKASKRRGERVPENPDFLQPPKKPGFSVSCPGSFKNSIYWQTLRPPGVSDSGQEQAQSAELPAMHVPGRWEASAAHPEEDTRQKAAQYQELVDECSQKSVKTIDSIKKWLMEVEQDAPDHMAESCNETKISSFSDTSWLNSFSADDRDASSFNLDTQLLNDITGQQSTAEEAEDFSLSPILDMIESSSGFVSPFRPQEMDFEQDYSRNDRNDRDFTGD